MARTINIPSLVQAIADAFTVDELRGFLGDYFNLRLDHIINPVGIGLIEIVRKVVAHFDRQGALVDLVRELEKERPDKIHLLSLLAPPAPTAPSAPVSVPASTSVDIEPEEVDFYFVIEPDRRTVPPASSRRPTNSIYVRIPVASASASSASGARRALSLAIDRSGSMQGGKIKIAHAAANYLLDLVAATSHKVAIVAFDDTVDLVVPIQSIPQSDPYKAQIRGISPGGSTDLFEAWQRSVYQLRTLDERWDRRVVLITDGQLNSGMVDPGRFEREVQQVWRREKIATSCVSMGENWNVELLNKLAVAGGGSLHFMKDEHQAEQILHEAFHTWRGVVAANLRAELETLGSARIIEVQGTMATLGAGARTVHPIVGHLRTNVEEYLVLRIEFSPPSVGQAAEILQARLLYEDPVTAETRSSPLKVLRVYSEETTAAAGQAIVHQGVVSTARTTLSRQLFKQALGAFLHGDAENGQTLLEQARFSLETARAPRGYQAAVRLQERRIQDIARFEGRVPTEYIKEKYIEELAHRDVVWMKLCELLDRLTRSMFEINAGIKEMFRWANGMIDEFEAHLPVHSEVMRQSRESTAEGFWFEKAHSWLERVQSEERSSDVDDQRSPSRAHRAVVVVAGACLGFERWRQGTREELVELMEGYLHSYLQFPGRPQPERD